MAEQAKNGKAFEWAVAKALQELTGYEIFDNDAANFAVSCFASVSVKKRANFVATALAGTKHILEKERNRLQNKKCQISLASDAEGQKGDVRDVLVIGDDVIIGISCKANHDALKHSRLSDHIDFIKKWGLDPDGCSQNYWLIIKALFDKLRFIKRQSNGKRLWSEIENYQQEYYWPILDAFTNEIERLETQKGVAADLLSYLIGKDDFYKLISTSNKVEIQGFNFNGSLSIQKSKLPDSIVAIDKKNGGQYSKTIRFNRGYTINFRIHSASSRVEPSLKFDIRALSFPPREIYNHHIEL